MAKIKRLRAADGTVETREVEDSAFGARAPRRVQREAVLMYLANRRSGTHDTLTRAEVNATIRKPWKQKHTGRARAGRTSSPLWRGGGIIFGPHPRDYSYAVPRKALRAATRAALAGKIQSGAVAMVDSVAAAAPRTRTMVRLFDALGIRGSCLVVLAERDDNVWKSLRNIPGASCRTADEVNAYDVLSHRTVLLTDGSFDALRKRLAAREITRGPAAAKAGE